MAPCSNEGSLSILWTSTFGNTVSSGQLGPVKSQYRLLMIFPIVLHQFMGLDIWSLLIFWYSCRIGFIDILVQLQDWVYCYSGTAAELSLLIFCYSCRIVSIDILVQLQDWVYRYSGTAAGLGL